MQRRKYGLIVCPRQISSRWAPVRAQNAGDEPADSARQRQQQAFGQHLPHDASAPRTQRQPHRELAPRRKRTAAAVRASRLDVSCALNCHEGVGSASVDSSQFSRGTKKAGIRIRNTENPRLMENYVFNCDGHLCSTRG